MMKMNYAEPIIDGYNAVTGAVVAVLSYILGEHWILFVAFLLLNVADWITGWMKSRMAGKENSECRMERRTKKTGVLADDYGSVRGSRGIYRDWKGYRRRSGDHHFAWVVCVGIPDY